MRFGPRLGILVVALSRVVDNCLHPNAIGVPEECVETIQTVGDATGVGRMVCGVEAMGNHGDVVRFVHLLNDYLRPQIRPARQVWRGAE